MLRSTILAAALAFAAHAAAAQEGQQPPAQPQQGAETVVKATHGDWEVRCAEGTQNCGMVQVVANPDGAPLMDVELVPVPNNQQAEALMRFRAPLGVLLPRGLEMRIDGGEPVTAPFLFCVQGGCVAQMGLTTQAVNTLKAGAAAQVSLYSAQQPDKPVQGRLSLMGFTASYGELR